MFLIQYYKVNYSLTLWEKLSLSVFENRAQIRKFGPQRDDVTGEWRKLHNEELNNPYSTPNIIRVIKSRNMRMAVLVVRMGKRCLQGFCMDT